jgi:hypothetical protein
MVRDFGVEEDTCLQLMLEHWNPEKAIPPWQADELEQKVANAYAYARDPAGTRSALADFRPVELEPGILAAKAYGLDFWCFDPAEKPVPKNWLIKDIMARGETAGWIGPPGSGKSAAILDVFMHGATGRDWRGHKHKEKTAFVYFAFERAPLTKRRIRAYAQQWGLTDVPIAVVNKVLNLMDPKAILVVSDTIKAVEDRYGVSVGGITFDTYPKGIAAGGGDENSAKDVNMVAANIRRLHEKMSLHVALIGHTGKDESRGSRGSNANQGDWDVDFRIAKKEDGVKTLRIEKANDQEEGPVTAFLLKRVKIGISEDLEDIMTSIVSEAEVTLEQHNQEPQGENMLVQLEKYLDMLEQQEFTRDDMRTAWGCTASTVRRRVEQLVDDDAITLTSEAVRGEDKKWKAARYRLAV